METDKGHDTLTLTASAEEVELSEVDYRPKVRLAPAFTQRPGWGTLPWS